MGLALNQFHGNLRNGLLFPVIVTLYPWVPSTSTMINMLDSSMDMKS